MCIHNTIFCFHVNANCNQTEKSLIYDAKENIRSFTVFRENVQGGNKWRRKQDS